jgi:hypothetical protein
MKVLDTVEVRPSNQQIDVRWGFVFKGSNGETVFSIYIEESGKKGVINGASVEFDSDKLAAWSKKSLGEVFE